MIETFDAASAEAVADDLAFIARLHEREIGADMLAALRDLPTECWFSLRLQGEKFEEGAKLMRLAFTQLPKPVTSAALDELAAEYAAIYLTHAYRASPYESVWRDEDHLERQAPMFEVRDWYQKYGVGAPDWRKRSEDHIALELEFLSQAIRAASDPDRARDAAAFLREHPLLWIPDFVRRVVTRCRDPFYAGLALLTLAYLERLSSLFEQAFGFDMTVIRDETDKSRADGPRRPTCADPPEKPLPGLMS
jgi:putative dimethyl sulfoxide reductase chaperone